MAIRVESASRTRLFGDDEYLRPNLRHNHHHTRKGEGGSETLTSTGRAMVYKISATSRVQQSNHDVVPRTRRAAFRVLPQLSRLQTIRLRTVPFCAVFDSRLLELCAVIQSTLRDIFRTSCAVVQSSPRFCLLIPTVCVDILRSTYFSLPMFASSVSVLHTTRSWDSSARLSTKMDNHWGRSPSNRATKTIVPETRLDA